MAEPLAMERRLYLNVTQEDAERLICALELSMFHFRDRGDQVQADTDLELRHWIAWQCGYDRSRRPRRRIVVSVQKALERKRDAASRTLKGVPHSEETEVWTGPPGGEGAATGSA